MRMPYFPRDTRTGKKKSYNVDGCYSAAWNEKDQQFEPDYFGDSKENLSHDAAFYLCCDLNEFLNDPSKKKIVEEYKRKSKAR